ncbi:hypothetical protein CRUP_029036 [Coryphaenoides rupestris]|nr:hypothetical protein CRUP_029036 [Coryphaenoides rupestris]
MNNNIDNNRACPDVPLRLLQARWSWTVAWSKRKDHVLQKLRELLAASNRKFEAMAVVLQQTLAEQDEVVRRRRELSQELLNLQGQLVCTTTSCERLEKEKEEVQASLEDALHRLEEQHQKELAQLEARLQAFYQAKLRTVHSGDLQSLQNTLKESEVTLSGQIQELREENDSLVEKLQAEEERRKRLAGKSQKDSHTLYLEQELESLKVVLDIKNKQLHQQEKKLVHLDTVVDKSVKLDVDRKKVQQENEDLKARMAKHAALSRQLSTEQAVLHESLQKESKVNKRLSMENEELLWKLHNGELSSPRRLSPTSPSHSHAGGLQSPRSSALFSSPPVSPR